eukprot:TRINITY_DN4858_c1_g2_i1.p1 TRINITY_DN4858_c1_g2~~TRINITY_DN4858_c1_g2_i1.p1  ORF type:complete len:302 (-),score=109.29 TRINITY_DN4858_c1_g2_i1:35-913(-)
MGETGNWKSKFRLFQDYQGTETSRKFPGSFKLNSNSLPSNFILEIPEKIPLNKSNNQCGDCGVTLSTGILKRALYCNYTGKYYCIGCHRNQTCIIPARVVTNYDKREYTVATSSLTHIEKNFCQPWINVGIVNPGLYELDRNLDKIRKLRGQLSLIGEFVKTCRNADRLIEKLAGREHLLESIHVYSLKDLSETKKLLENLYHVMGTYISHVTKSCETCRGKGNFCEICESKELIFSFQLNSTWKCPNCKALFHRECRQVQGGNFTCPKCQRISEIHPETSFRKLSFGSFKM